MAANTNIEDRLINVQIGTAKRSEIIENEIETIYLELDDQSSWKNQNEWKRNHS